MRRGSAVADFANVLDEKLLEEHVAAAAAPRACWRPPTLGFFVFDSPAATSPARRPAFITTESVRADCLDACAHRFPATPRPVETPRGYADTDARRRTRRPPTPQRDLSAAQLAALQLFVELGAPIGPDFSRDELRSAFRRLAHRFHPDRHPSSADQERARLSALFGQAREAYQLLRAAPARQHD